MTISVQFWKSNQEVLDHCANWKELHCWKSMTQFRRYVKLSTKVVKTKIVASSIDLINDALKRVLLNTFSFYNFQLFENQLLNFSFSKTQPWNLELLTLFQISVRNFPENSTLADFLRCKTLLPPSFLFSDWFFEIMTQVIFCVYCFLKAGHLLCKVLRTLCVLQFFFQLKLKAKGY